jgi:hypothetical protein
MALAVGMLATAPAVAFHNHLTRSVPRADEVLVRAPTTIRLWFSERPTPAFSSITLLAADSTRIPTSKPRATDDTLSIESDVQGPLAAGAYQVVWRTAGKDGHAVRGKYRFTIKP